MIARDLTALLERVAPDAEIRIERPGEPSVAVESAYLEQPFLGNDRIVLVEGN